MTHYHILSTEYIEKLLFDTQHLSIYIFKSNLNTSINSKYTTIFSLIETLIIDEKFYHFFCSSYLKSLAFQQNEGINYRFVLNYGYDVVSQLFSSKAMFYNYQFVINATLKKCDIDIFLLIAITKGYLLNSAIKRDKIKTFFIQSFKKNNNHFTGISRFTQFHQSLLYKSPTANTFTYNQSRSYIYRLQLSYFIAFYSYNKDFFPSTLQCDNLLFKMMISLKLYTEEEIRLYEKFYREYFNENQYHLITTCKNIRFLIEFFRNPFNYKVIEFYPQKVFIKIINKYKRYEIDKILSYSEIGLTWSEYYISSCIGNIFKLGLTSTSFILFKSLLELWLRNGLIDLILKISETYIPKVFIFMKHYKLFDTSLSFLQQFTLGPRTPTINILNKLLYKLLTFQQKDCPVNKKHNILEFMCLIESKYEKIATLEDKSYIELRNILKNIRETYKRYILKDYYVKYKLKALEWYYAKVSLFSKSGAYNKISAQKYAGEYRGLYNIGNSCYMNSFLQCLYMTIEFRYNILNQSTLALEQRILKKMQYSYTTIDKASMKYKEAHSNQQTNKSLIARYSIRPTAELQRFFAQLMKSKRSAVSPITIKNVSSPEFKNTFQQDTIYFGRSFLDIVTKSSLYNIFYGEQTNYIICPNCHQSRYKKENFIDIMLTDYDDEYTKGSDYYVKSENEGFKIGKMMGKFFEAEKMYGLTCDFCEVKSQYVTFCYYFKSLKKHYISKLPNYLILTMKRFCYDKKENKNVKKHYRIDLSYGLIKVEEYFYYLYGIIVHRGQSANSGHYFAFCKEWKFDEKIVSEQLQEEKLKSNMYNQIKDGGNNEKMYLENYIQFYGENSPQSNLKYLTQNIQKHNSPNRWLCLNDCNVSVFESFNNVKYFFDMNQYDTPYVLFYQKLSHLYSPYSQHLKHSIKLRYPLEKFLYKDNSDYIKFVYNKMRGNQNPNQVNWKNFGKVKGFTAYDFFKFTKQDDDENGSGFGGGGFGNTPII